MAKEYRTISEIAGPLIFVEKTDPVGYNELVEVQLGDGRRQRGQVLDSSTSVVVVQVFEGTAGIDRASSVKFLGETIKLSVSREMLGRVLTGSGEPADGGPPIIPEKRVEIQGAAINPYSREHPAEFIQTGISTIDGLNTLVRGQKLPLFSGAGLPHNEIALQIARQSKVLGSQAGADIPATRTPTSRRSTSARDAFMADPGPSRRSRSWRFPMTTGLIRLPT